MFTADAGHHYDHWLGSGTANSPVHASSLQVARDHDRPSTSHFGGMHPSWQAVHTRPGLDVLQRPAASEV